MRKRSFLAKDLNPLLLSALGASVQVKHSSLIIKDVSINKEISSFEPHTFPYDCIVINSPFGSVSLEAFRWLAKHNVSFYYMDFSGNIISQTIPGDNDVHAKIRIAQFRVHENLDLRLQVASKIINDKNNACLHLLHSLGFETPSQIPNTFEDFKDLTNSEAEFSRFYWAKISEWIRENTKFTEYRGRGNGEYQTNKNEKDVVNCALNLGYKLLENACRLAINSVGFIPDVSFGIHESRTAKSPTVYDIMEHGRVLVDRKILDLLQANKLTPKDFAYRRSDYTFRLNEKAKELIIRSVMDALNLNDIVLYTKGLAHLCIDLAPESEPLTPIAKGSKHRHERDRERYS